MFADVQQKTGNGASVFVGEHYYAGNGGSTFVGVHHSVANGVSTFADAQQKKEMVHQRS